MKVDDGPHPVNPPTSAIRAAHATSGEPNPSKRKRSLPGTPDPEAEVVALSPRSLMATNRFVCEICKKGFQRDQNLQLHRRGHNLPWKLKQRSTMDVRKKVYICPETSCVHHDPARALGDLTGIKKHYSRKHGEKKWKCEKCSKKYAVQSDWKAHVKVCGTREYKCDCGTLFSRKDSFITHRAFCDALAEVPPASLSFQFQQCRLPNWVDSSNFYSASLPEIAQRATEPENHWFNAGPEVAQFAMDMPSASPSIPRMLKEEDKNGEDGSLLSGTISSIYYGSQPQPPPSMSATALLQKAAQLGSTRSTNSNLVVPTSFSDSSLFLLRHQAAMEAESGLTRDFLGVGANNRNSQFLPENHLIDFTAVASLEMGHFPSGH